MEDKMGQYLYGIDLGGTSTKFGLFSLEGNLIDKFSIKTNTTQKGKNIINNIAKALNNHINKMKINREDVKGVGIGVPGPVSHGIVNRCVNLGWGKVNVQKELETLTGIKVAV